MKFINIASGSKGNSYLLMTENANILIDLGISYKKLTTALKEIGVHKIDYAFISHEHTDHISGLYMFCKNTDARVFMSKNSYENYSDNYKIPAERLDFFTPGDELVLDSIIVETFKTPHDSRDSVGFKVSADGVVYSHVTDLGHMPKLILNKISESDMVTIESNYDKNMLTFGSYPYMLKKRILSSTGHLSNDESLICVAHLLQCGVNDIILAHLSEANNNPEILRNEFANLKFTYSVNENQNLHIATPKFENLILEIRKACLI